MAIEEIGGIEIYVQDGKSDSVYQLVKKWKESPYEFKKDRRAVDDSEMKKIYIGDGSSRIVLERKDGKYVVRRSN